MRDEGSHDNGDGSPPGGLAGRSVWRERALVLLIVACLGGTLHLVISIHRRALRDRLSERPLDLPVSGPPAAAARQPAPVPPPAAPLAEAPKPAPPSRAEPPAEDPTQKALAELAAATAQEIEAGRQADRKVQALEAAHRGAVAESQRWRRRELLVRQQVDALAQRAQQIDRQIDTLAAQRDVLAHERDALKAAVAKTQQGEGSYAVLPYKGPNGSWRRPIVLECSNGAVTLRPGGPTFSMLDVSAMIQPRSSPVIRAIARELLRVQNSDSPDGAPVVPYFVFLVRPDGIRPYYELRARLEPLGIAFGYELIEQDLKVDVPDLDNVATWDGTIPLDDPRLASSGSPRSGAGGTDNDDGDGLVWPQARSRPSGRDTGSPGMRGGHPPGPPALAGSDADRDDDASPDGFVWPSRRGLEPARPRALAPAGSPLAAGSIGPLTGNATEKGAETGTGPGAPGLPDLEPAGEAPDERGAAGAPSGRTRRVVPTRPARPGTGTGIEIGARRGTGTAAGTGTGTGTAAGTGKGSAADAAAQAAREAEDELDRALLGNADGSLFGPSPPAGGASGPGGMGSPSGAAASGGGTPGGSPAGSGLMLGGDAAPGGSSGESGSASGLPRIGSRIADGPPRTIEVPFEITVVCQPEGLMIHPGSYRITKAALEQNRKDGVLVRELLAVARNRAAADPTIRPRPRVRFLVENGGSTMFWNARKQILFSGLGWPMSLQVSGAQEARLLDPEIWR